MLRRFSAVATSKDLFLVTSEQSIQNNDPKKVIPSEFPAFSTPTSRPDWSTEFVDQVLQPYLEAWANLQFLLRISRRRRRSKPGCEG